MIELRFHHELYDGFAVDEAAKVFGPYATLDLVREPDGYIVRLTASESASQQGFDEKTIAAELATYALGLTVERQGAGTEGAGASPEEKLS